MPSVFTIQGPDIELLGQPRRRKKAKKAKKAKKRSQRRSLGVPANCKCVYNPKTGNYSQLCYVGKAESPTGWKFVKGGAKRCGR